MPTPTPFSPTGAAAALAAISLVFRGHDAAFSLATARKARSVFRFATSEDLQPRSYCAFVPCSTTVTVTDQVGAAAEGEGSEGGTCWLHPRSYWTLMRHECHCPGAGRQEGGEACMEVLHREQFSWG